MGSEVIRTNRGPAAAADNRAALLRSARRLFAEQGYHVPLSAVARDSGVGQGSLYRHFPTKHDLAEAIFAENLAELEAAAGERSDSEGSFTALWSRIVDQMVDSVGFVEVVFNSADPAQYVGLEHRLRVLLDVPLAAARNGGEVDPELTIDAVVLCLRMIFGAIHVEGGPPQRRDAARQALGLIGRGLQVRSTEPADRADNRAEIHQDSHEEERQS